MLQKAPLVAKIHFDTAENGPSNRRPAAETAGCATGGLTTQQELLFFGAMTSTGKHVETCLGSIAACFLMPLSESLAIFNECVLVAIIYSYISRRKLHATRRVTNSFRPLQNQNESETGSTLASTTPFSHSFDIPTCITLCRQSKTAYKANRYCVSVRLFRW